MNTDLLHPKENLTGKFHTLGLPDQVIHIFPYYSLAQSTSSKCNVIQFYACLQNALHPYLVMYEDATHEPMSFKATQATQSLYFDQLSGIR
jgi:hypothetical protein